MRTLKAGGADVVLCAPPTRSPRRTTWPRRSSRSTASRPVRHQGRGRRHLLLAHRRVRRPQAADHHGRRRRRGGAAPLRAHRLAAQASSAAPRRPPPVSSASRPWSTTACCSYPIVAVNDADTKHLFDNRYGTGQSHARRHHPRHQPPHRRQHRRRRRLRLVRPRRRHAGRRAWRRRRRPGGRSAPRARGRHGRLPGHADGSKRPPIGDIFVTVTGDIHVIRGEHFEVMKDGAIVANSGHFNVEIDIPRARELSVERRRPVRDFVEEFTLADGRRTSTCWARAGSINLAAAEGHPASVMDMSFANQALAAEYMVKNAADLEKRVYVRAGGDRRRDRPAEAGDHGRRTSTRSPPSRPSTSRPGTRAPEPAVTVSSAWPGAGERVGHVHTRHRGDLIVDLLGYRTVDTASSSRASSPCTRRRAPGWRSSCP